MNCELACVGQVADGKYLLRCAACERELLVVNPTKRRKATCGNGARESKDGPGTELAGIIKELRQKQSAGCGCAAMRREMNKLGVDGCRQERDRLAGKLRTKLAKLGFSEKVRAALATAMTGIARKINWLDPCPGLIDLAIERATVRSSARRQWRCSDKPLGTPSDRPV